MTNLQRQQEFTIEYRLPDYPASQPQRQYVELIVDPAGPSETWELAEKCGVEPAEILRWESNPRFREWLQYAVEERFKARIPLLYKALWRMAETEGPNQITAVQILLGRFDTRALVSSKAATELPRQFAKALAQQHFKAAK